MNRILSRGAVVAAGVMTLLAGATTAAHAGDTVEYVTVNGIHRGKITHFDDGDVFEVCDLRADGKGVRGSLAERGFPGFPWKTRAEEGDGGDKGCDYFQHDVTETYPPWDNYRLKICWKQHCDTDKFHE